MPQLFWWTSLSCWWKWCNYAFFEQEIPFWKTELWIQMLSYVEPNTWNSLSGNLKYATSVDSFKHYIKECNLKRLGNVEVDIYSLPKLIQK